MPYIHINWTRTIDTAVVPSKSRESDAGYDLTIINNVKSLGTNTVLFDTGIQVEMPPEHYLEIVPRSSLSKSGYILTNSIGIIDNAYRGTILVALTKIDTNAPDIELPCRAVQAIIRKQYHGIWTYVDKLNESDRGESAGLNR